MLSHELWRTAFGADPGVVGRTVLLNRQRVTVVGVAADGTFSGTSFLGGGYVAPLNAGKRLVSADSRYDTDAAPWLRMFGRRLDGVGLDQVRSEMNVIAGRSTSSSPGDRPR